MIKIPYGLSNFKSVMENAYCYVDRTNFIQPLEDYSRFVFFLRPRRFGKSLFISMLHYYYGLEYAEQFQNLFGKLAVGKNPTPKANKYLVLSLEFSRINTQNETSTLEGFLSNVKSGVDLFLTEYQSFFTESDASEILTKDQPSEVIKALFSYHQKRNVPYPIYILIDEYDHFANELISFNFDVFTRIVSRNGFVRKFFESIKTATRDGVVDRLFVTGVSPITLDSLTSGFNIGKNLTTVAAFNNMMGFVEEEVKDILQGVEVPKENFEQVLSDVRSWYNGYLFNAKAKERVYNPDMVLYFADCYQPSKEYPDTLLDVNIASDYSKIRKLFKIQNKEADNLSVLKSLSETGEVSAVLTEQFSFEKDFNREDLVSLLFYMGFLTIKKSDLGKLFFGFPNFVIEKLYADYFVNVLQEKASLPIDNSHLNDSIISLAKTGSLDLFLAEANKILLGLSNRDSLDFSEVSVKAIFVALLRQQSFYYVHSEYETDKKYVDVYLQAIRGYDPTFEVAFEFKYLKKKDADQKEAVIKAAELQLKNYLKTNKFEVLNQLKAFVVVCVGTVFESYECCSEGEARIMK